MSRTVCASSASSSSPAASTRSLRAEAAILPDLSQRPSSVRGHLREPVRPEHQQGDHHDHDDLAKADVGHGPSVRRDQPEEESEPRVMVRSSVLRAALDRDRDLVAGLHRADVDDQRGGVGHGLAVELDDDIARLEAGCLCRATRGDLLDARALTLVALVERTPR